MSADKSFIEFHCLSSDPVMGIIDGAKGRATKEVPECRLDFLEPAQTTTEPRQFTAVTDRLVVKHGFARMGEGITKSGKLDSIPSTWHDCSDWEKDWRGRLTAARERVS